MKLTLNPESDVSYKVSISSQLNIRRKLTTSTYPHALRQSTVQDTTAGSRNRTENQRSGGIQEVIKHKPFGPNR